MQEILRDLHFERIRNQQTVIKDITINNHRLLYKERPGAALGSILWSSSISLCQYITQHLSVFENKTVIELGSGLGLPSILASRVAKHCIATEKPEMMQILRENVDMNDQGSIECTEMQWGESIGKFDIVIGADVVYDISSFNVLYTSIIDSCKEDSTVFIAYKLRHTTEQQFFDRMNQHFKCLSTEPIGESQVFAYVKKVSID